MRCAHVSERLSAYLDGELGAVDRERVTAHLETCEACRAKHAALAQVQALFARASRYETDAWLARRVLAAVHSGPPRRRPLLPVALKLTARAAALMAVVALGVASGSLLANGSGPAARAAGPVALFSLDLFAAAPPDSPGGVYLALTEVGRD